MSVIFFPVLFVLLTTGIAGDEQTATRKPILIAHRGASAYAPEHTLAAYRLAIEQGADFVEQDLQLTKDGTLICLHDADLARTTNVAKVFPDRATTRDVNGDGKARQGWYAVDFTLAEIKRLDAGSWFNRANPFAFRAEFVGERVPTLQEAIDAIGNRAGFYIELKQYGFYRGVGQDMVDKLIAVLTSNGLADSPDRIFIQSFSRSALLRLKQQAPQYRRVQLLPMQDRVSSNGSEKITRALAREIATYAQGVGPGKRMLQTSNEVALLHEAGLLVHPYTFRGSTTAASRKPLDQKEANGSLLSQNVVAEIQRYLSLGIDGGFTDYPDLWRLARSK